MDIKPTRSELINLKQRIKLARKGRDILKRKLDALIAELQKYLEAAKDARREFNEAYDNAKKKMDLAIAYDGLAAIKATALGSLMNLDVSLKPKNIMGIWVPEISYEISGNLGGVSPLTVSTRIHEASQAYREAVEKAMALVEAEMIVKKLLLEIDATKRKVNALDYKLIPDLEDAKSFISLHLEELEREDFVRLKKVAGKTSGT